MTLCMWVYSVFLAFTKACQIIKHDSLLQWTCFHWSRVNGLYTTPTDAWHWTKWSWACMCAAVQPRKLISRSSLFLCWCCFQWQFGNLYWMMDNFYVLCALALESPALWFHVVYFFIDELLLPLDALISHYSYTKHLQLQLTGADLAGQKFSKIVDITMFKVLFVIWYMSDPYKTKKMVTKKMLRCCLFKEKWPSW